MAERDDQALLEEVEEVVGVLVEEVTIVRMFLPQDAPIMVI